MTQDLSGDRTSPLSDDRLEQVVDRYMEELADGRQPDQEAYLRQHPELAEQLKGVFKTLQLVEAAGKSLNASKLEKGQKLGEFRIVREIGRGGMGVVYEAVQTSLSRRVALKVLPANVILSDNAFARFHREAHTGGRLHHTNIVPVYAVGEECGISYYAMQLIEGRSLTYYLKTAITEVRKLDREHYRRVARWGQQVADALAYAHDQGIIHRDIKPANLLYDSKDHAWVFDFGLARADDDPTITQTGDVLGTVRYMSPEQAGGTMKLDGRTDIYSLGATLYELACFRPAFEGESREKVLQQVLHEDPVPLRQTAAGAPRDLETIIAKCMQKQPAHRYQRASELAEDLRRFLAGEPIQARRTPLYVKAVRWVRRHRGAVAAAVLIAVLSLPTVMLMDKLRREEGQRCLDDAYMAIMFDQEYKRGLELLDRAAALGVQSPPLHLYRALAPLLNEQPLLALPHIERVQRLDPQNLCALYALAKVHVDMGDFYNSQRVFRQEGLRQPDDALGWFLRGFALSRHQESDAIECYNKALLEQPDFVAAILSRATYRGFRLITEGRREDLEPMLNDFDAVVVFRPKSAVSYSSRAWGWLTAAASAAAQTDLRDKHESWLESCRKDLAEAMRLRRRDDPEPLFIQAIYLRYTGDFQGSAKLYGDGLRMDQLLWGKPRTYYVHARAIGLHASGDVETALEGIEPACETQPGSYSLTLHRAMLLAELGRIEQAREVCRATLKSQAGHATGLFMAAAVAEFLGIEAEGRAAVLALETRDPGDVTFEYLPQTTGGEELEYHAGRIDGETLLKAAGENPGKRCERSFHIALRELGRGRREAGLAALRTCLETGVLYYGDYRFAQVLLARAEADPTWPRWVATSDPSDSPLD